MVDPANLCSYVCWQDDSIMTRTRVLRAPRDPSLAFVVDLRVRYRRDHQNPSHDDDQLLLWRQSVMMLNGDRFLSGDDSEKFKLRSYLHRQHPWNLPESVEESIVNNSVELARTMVDDPWNFGQMLLPMAVDVVIRGRDAAIRQLRFERRGRDAIGRATWESMQVVRFVPATKSSIEALEKVANILDEKNSCLLEEADQCSICLDTLSVGAEVTRMPCSHMFHAGCIVRWLKTSNLCPLCRFAMPC